MRKLYIDLETRSKTTPKKVGAYRYAEDPSTEVHCVAWTIGEEPIRLWKAGDDLVGSPESEEASRWFRLVEDPGLVKVAHNVEFEKNVLLHRFGIHVPVEQWSDTAARAARMSLPRSLEDIGAALGLDKQKDMEGHRVMMKLARTRRPSKDLRDEFWSAATKPEDFEKLYTYCADDVEVMRVVDRILPELSEEERAIWELTIRMNELGVKVDLAALPRAQAEAKIATTHLVEEFTALVGVSPTSPKAAALLKLPDVTKATIREGLKTATGPLRRAMELRQLVARSSVKKLRAFEVRTMKDGRIRGSLMYAGAERTLRWAGSGVQPQNFPRGMGKETEDAFLGLHAGVFAEAYDDVLKALADMLRGFFVGPFLVGDFAQIEARVLAWLAGQEDLVETFRTGGDPYCEMASSIYRRPITKKDKDQRFIGKTVVLGCGYGLGGKKFQAQLDTVYDVQVDLDFAESAVRAFRSKYKKIPELWRLLERGFAFAVGKKSTRIKVGPLFMGTLEVNGIPFAFIELPSGRKMFYARPELREDGRVHYLGRNLYAGGRWETVSTYGGKLAENIVQAISRDLLAQAMVRLDEAGFKLALTVHDEVVAEDDGNGLLCLETFEKMLTWCPPWAEGLPLGVEAFRCKRYHK